MIEPESSSVARAPSVPLRHDPGSVLRDLAALPQSRATLADVGRLAGVSAKTVSRVVTDSGSVSVATRDRVLSAAQTLRFRPNHLARSLRHGSVTDTVAFVIGDLANPFYVKVAAGVEEELAQHELMMILAATHDDPQSERKVVENLLKHRVRGLLMVPIADDQAYLENERQLGTPVVCIDRPARNLIADAVVLDNFRGTVDATRSLLQAGHRRIGFVCSPAELYTHQERLRGFRSAMREGGVSDSVHWERLEPVTGRSEEESVRELLALPDPPTAIIAGNNRASAGVIRELGRRFQEFAFIGFDDFDLADAWGISVVTYDPAELGRQAVRLMMQRLQDRLGPPVRVDIPTHVVQRGSGEYPPRAAAHVPHL
ncbi:MULTISPECIES: LacI family DNA-binding transcriptional regulator [unclassified Cryobacterium]|uniref:LacI family DNA-binding transcriptional regulator n=2 Tax=Bacteria TaxID=2 RepID=UPI002AB3D09A|nr:MULTISPECIES: LacI family DNA-binding transcriptional regulator [Cryobacterium]MDY7529962.1 LacI family DNA-binding transcriptional regulator [Cryobacterium sp. 10C2]MDY7544497.1 LacI family DNA-binding transcriptional regulator [Cryobacterium sp. 5B3]MDY7557900.1 LacI family DNA-binding transcriptional regulator [Cryobacterium sp. 10C3]MEB0276210.1 LacI family DNA-binding transcriptional regulator [Cryobacterium sp. 5B3]MEB0287835.1 LacI family DNA-binding transcriptional regulator [Cryoba